MTELDKKEAGQLVLLFRKAILPFCVLNMPEGAMDFLWGNYLLGFRREQLKISPSVTDGTREPLKILNKDKLTHNYLVLKYRMRWVEGIKKTPNNRMVSKNCQGTNNLKSPEPPYSTKIITLL